jgi:diaminohydroxyphosphoribosylaminopyrimidine deaminase/5-amino-6-(5-phosphoribosylamino)uracil reductase
MSAGKSAFATDERWMRAALALARRGLGRTWPNPAVGCVIVKNDRAVGQGWTQPGGRPHAETEALAMASADAAGATAYVTLEPCSHHGRTPPCTGALIGAGVTRVVVACGDPDPRVSGRGFAALQEANVTVTHGVLQAEAERLNRGFLKRHREGLPLVTLKVATTLDARIATVTGESQWITGPDARNYGHLLRATHDAIMVGKGTVEADNPSLTCRLPGLEERSPVRVFLDTNGTVAGNLHLLAGNDPPVWRIAAGNVPPLPGIETIANDLGPDGRIDLRQALQSLAGRGITRLLVEGGGTLAASLIRGGLVDRIEWARAASLIGGDGLPAIGPLGVQRIADMQGFALVESRALGDDILSIYERG